jgi:(p)ppGpp synthase/HD superfamily hydrolase
MFSEKIELAINIAAKAHEKQYRITKHKWPYVSHSFNVAMILSKYNFPEEVVIAGILHDIIEDTQYDISLIEKNFGKKVRKIVEAVSQPHDMKFQERKKYQLNYLKNAPIEVKAVKTADKLHNLYSKIFALREKDNIFLKILDSSAKESLDGYKETLGVLRNGRNHPILAELDKYIKEYGVLLKKNGY